jgi:collagenase-like PrtC family protease
MDRVTLGFEVMAARHRAQRRAESVRRLVTEAQARGVSVVVALLPDDGGA